MCFLGLRAWYVSMLGVVVMLLALGRSKSFSSSLVFVDLLALGPLF